jgi:mono/diheme cytochrome c family protein
MARRRDGGEAGGVAGDLAAAPSSAARVGLLRQVAALIGRAGAQKWDVCIFMSVYLGVVLLAGVMYAGARLGNAEGWRWGLKLMNVPLAATGLGLLVVASLTSCAALLLAGRNPDPAGASARGLRRPARRWGVAICLAVACLGCLGFAATVLLDHDAKAHYGVRPGDGFRPNERYVARRFGVRLPAQTAPATAPLPVVATAPPAPVVDADKGHKLFIGTCASCHGLKGEGMPGQGKPLVQNTFIQGQDDAQMLAFLKIGRQSWDPANTTKVQMPPRGGNPALSDDHLRDIVAFLRTQQGEPKPAQADPAAAPTAVAQSSALPSSAPAAVAQSSALPPSTPADADEFALRLSLHRWVVSEPPRTPGLQAGFVDARARPRWAPPAGASAFVNAYYSMTQFQLLQVGLLLVLLGCTLVQALRGLILPETRGLLALSALACCWVTALWVAAFPFVYLV